MSCAAGAVRTSCSWAILKLMHVSINAGGDACIDRVNGPSATAINGQRHGSNRALAPEPTGGAHDGHPAMDVRSNANASVHPNTPRAEALLCGKL
jgi:hypothetical protein